MDTNPPSRSKFKNDDDYANAWLTIIGKIEKVLPGYVVSQCNPGFVLEKRVINEAENTYKVVDRASISFELAIMLISLYGDKNA